jgi:hypothetical protein
MELVSREQSGAEKNCEVWEGSIARHWRAALDAHRLLTVAHGRAALHASVLLLIYQAAYVVVTFLGCR